MEFANNIKHESGTEMPARRESLRQKLRRWLKPPRKLKATIMGRFVIGLSIVMGVAAVNTGNNLLYLILGSVFGLIAASGILSEQSMKNLLPGRTMPAFALQNHPCTVLYRVQNPKKRQTAYLIEVHEAQLPDEIATLPTLLPAIGPGTAESMRMQLTCGQRGVFVLPALRIETRYPFDFYRRSYEVETPDTLVVGPEPVRHGDAPLALDSASGRHTAPDDFDRVRPITSGDPLKLVHWKRTAAMGEWYVRTGEGGQDEAVVFDLRTTGSEEELQNLCWWILHYVDKRKQVTLATPEDTLHIDAARNGLAAVMRALAEWQTERNA